MRLFLSIFILFFSLLSSVQAEHAIGDINIGGGDVPSQSSKSVTEKKQLINQLYQWMNQATKDPSTISQAKIEKFFQPNVTYTVNGKQLADNSEKLAKRLKLLARVEKSVQVQLPLDSMTVAKNMAAISYKINITTKTNNKYTDIATVIMKFDHDKISQWQAVIAHQ